MYGTSDKHKVFSSHTATLDKLGLGSAEAKAHCAMGACTPHPPWKVLVTSLFISKFPGEDRSCSSVSSTSSWELFWHKNTY